MSGRIQQRIVQALEKRAEEGLLRQLIQTPAPVDFSSNDYLGLARSESLHHRTLEILETVPVKNGSTGSRLLTGNSRQVELLEQDIAAFHGSEAALLFNSGYTANLAVFSTLPRKEDVIFYDEFCHASIREGIRLSAAKSVKFKHNDLADLEQKLRKNQLPAFAVTESVFSMDGDAPDLPRFLALRDMYSFFAAVDEAHSIGLLGEMGAGADLRVITYGKAPGVHGAAVLCTQPVKNYLINFARSLIYTTALAPHSLAAIQAVYTLLPGMNAERDAVQHNKNHFVKLISSSVQQKITTGPGAICTVRCPGNEAVTRASAHLKDKGLDVRPVKSPTVKAGAERLRICFHAYNTQQEIALLAETLNELCRNEFL